MKPIVSNSQRQKPICNAEVDSCLKNTVRHTLTIILVFTMLISGGNSAWWMGLFNTMFSYSLVEKHHNYHSFSRSFGLQHSVQISAFRKFLEESLCLVASNSWYWENEIQITFKLFTWIIWKQYNIMVNFTTAPSTKLVGWYSVALGHKELKTMSTRKFKN